MVLKLKKLGAATAPDPASNDTAGVETLGLKTDLQRQIDLVGELTAKAEPVLKKIAAEQEKLTELKNAKKKLEELLSAYEAGDDDEPKVEGDTFRLEAGKRAVNRTVKNIAKIAKMLGQPQFMKLVSIKLGDLDKYLTQPQRDQVIETTRGDRSYKIIRKAP